MKYLLGIDLGSSSVKASLVNVDTGETGYSNQFPKVEMEFSSERPGYAEQDPDFWWKQVCLCCNELSAKLTFTDEIAAIGIAYQMHGLVVLDAEEKLVHDSIIWCDSRAVDIGKTLAEKLGQEFCFENYHNLPGNFTASKLAWLKVNKPNVFDRVKTVMLPGDYIALKMGVDSSSTITGLSEGIFWNFKKKDVSTDLLNAFGASSELLPKIVDNFTKQGLLSKKAAKETGLQHGIPIAYRAGDQPNNAYSLNVLAPGELATTAGTSGVVYGVGAIKRADARNRVNIFAHVNYTKEHPVLGTLMCLNGCGIQYRWLKNLLGLTYEELNRLSLKSSVGSNGLMSFPFGNGAERILENKILGSRFNAIDFNQHSKADIIRGTIEGIAYALNYGLEIMQEMGIDFSVIKTGPNNLFQSSVFSQVFADLTNVPLEFYSTDGAAGAARGAGVGAGIFASQKEAFNGLKLLKTTLPGSSQANQQESYRFWKEKLEIQLSF